jgi:hypothetical protein
MRRLDLCERNPDSVAGTPTVEQPRVLPERRRRIYQRLRRLSFGLHQECSQ